MEWKIINLRIKIIFLQDLLMLLNEIQTSLRRETRQKLLNDNASLPFGLWALKHSYSTSLKKAISEKRPNSNVITVLRLQIWQKNKSKNLWKCTVLKIIFSTALPFHEILAIWKGIFSTLCALMNLQTSNCNGSDGPVLIDFSIEKIIRMHFPWL